MKLTAVVAAVWCISGAAGSPEQGPLPVVKRDAGLRIDNFVKQWKLDHPDISDSDVKTLHASAEKLKREVLVPKSSGKSSSQPKAKSNVTDGHVVTQRNAHSLYLRNGTAPPKLHHANSTLEEARRIVHLAKIEAGRRNSERMAHPRVNTYYDRMHSKAAMHARAQDTQSLAVSAAVAAAAAMVAEADARNKTVAPLPEMARLPDSSIGAPLDINTDTDTDKKPKSDSNKMHKRKDDYFWMEHVNHDESRVPYGGSQNDGYQVFRNVKDYGAVGDGKADDTEAINKAMKDGNRCGANCGSSTIKPAIIYFPVGQYLVSSPIEMFYNTQVIGNFNGQSIIRATGDFVGLGVLSSDFYTGGNGGEEEWFINQNNFLRQVRNLQIDIRDVTTANVSGIHWQVAQATSLHNIQFIMSEDKDRSQIGIFAENGSGGFMGDLSFTGGEVGIRCGNQQFTANSLSFVNTKTAIDLLWDWGWTWKDLFINNAETGLKMTGVYRGGSVIVLDSSIQNTKTAISIDTPKGAKETEEFSVTLLNVETENVGVMVHHQGARKDVSGAGDKTYKSWVLGKIYDKENPQGQYSQGEDLEHDPDRSGLLFDKDGKYFTRSKNQYHNLHVDDIFSARTLAKGDGLTDDTINLAMLIDLAVYEKRPIYFPMGSYIITDTIKVPESAILIGECWAQIVAKGPKFQDIDEPRALLAVGEKGQSGNVEISDLLLTVEGPTAGAILMQWNIAQTNQGSAAMWDTHFRVGGAAGSGLTKDDCPKLTGHVNEACMAASALLHMTSTSSGYLENVWAWVADHDLDSGQAQTQIDIYSARGILIESNSGATWLYGTSSEHSVLYQYQLVGAENIFMGMIQTESPYYLPKPQAPAPFDSVVGEFPGDPDFSGCPASDPHCAASWGVRITGATNVHILGAGLYNWFQDYTQPCVDSQDCQKSVMQIEYSGQIWLYNLYTIGTVEMLNYEDGEPILSKDNTNTNEHPFTSALNAWLVAYDGEGSGIDGGYSDDSDDEPENMPDCNQHFASMDELEKEKDNIPFLCSARYIAQTQLDTLKTALTDYNTIIGDDYHSKFEVYHRLMAKQMPAQIDYYVLQDDKSKAFFHCTRNVHNQCCEGCGGYLSDPNCGTYDFCKKKKRSLDQRAAAKDDVLICHHGTADIPYDCPHVIEDSIVSSSGPSYRYVITDEAGFKKRLEDEYGVPSEWLDFRDYRRYGPGFCGDQACIDKNSLYAYNRPMLKKDWVLPDPAETVGKMYDNMKKLADMSEALIDEALVYSEEWAPTADALLMPAMTVKSAVDEMRKIVEVADEEIERERKEAIAGWISAIFFMVPIAGEIAGAVGGTLLRTIVTLAGDLADLAYSMYDVASDPDNGVLDIMGALLGGVGGGFSKGAFKSASKRVRNMPRATINKLPASLKKKTHTARELRAACGKK